MMYTLVSYEGKLLQLARQSRYHAPAKSKVIVRQNQAGELAIEYRGRRLGFQQIPHRPARQNTTTGPPLEPKLQADAHPTGRPLNHQPEGDISNGQKQRTFLMSYNKDADIL